MTITFEQAYRWGQFDRMKHPNPSPPFHALATNEFGEALHAAWCAGVVAAEGYLYACAISASTSTVH